jgi:hypothetical protein
VKHRAAKVISLTLVSILLSVLVTPSANSVPGGVTYTGETRVVPIFTVSQAGGGQPTQVSSSGFLYSSRIVFTAGVQDRLFDQAKGGMYVGKPGSRTTDKSGRVKVLKAFYPNSGNAELDDFVVLVLEKDLVSVEPFPLLQMGQESSVREASVRGYGEYQDRCGPGAQGPCPEKPTSDVPRQINVNVIPLSQAENLVGYERPQLSSQIILQNAKSAQDGVVCRGDTGSPVIGNLGGTGVYLGAASRSMNGKICGAVGVEKVDRDKPKVSTSFDGIAGITHIAPVYRYSGVINEAQVFATQTPTPTPTSSIIPSGQSVVSLKTTKSYEHDNEKVQVNYTGDANHLKSKPTGFRFFNGYEGTLLRVSQISLANAECTNPSITQLECTFPNFNPYKNILIKNKKQGVTLQVAPYNNAGQGPISPGVNMHEPVWTSRSASIDFVDREKVIKDIYGTDFWSWNLGGMRSKSTESKAKLRFVFQGPRLPNPEVTKPKVTFTKDKNSQKSKKYRMILAGYKYQDGMHQIEYESWEKVKFTGDSKFYAEFEIVDELGFRRAGISDFFTYGYDMDWYCSIPSWSLRSVRTTEKVALKTYIAGFNAVNRAVGSVTFDKVNLPNFLKEFFNSPEFVAERALSAIEASEGPDGFHFKVYLKEQAADIGKELTTSFTKKVIRQSKYKAQGNLPIVVYDFVLTVQDAKSLMNLYFYQVDDWIDQNAELITENCAKQ